MSLRILGGKFRGRLLHSPKGEQTRPTTSMLRKAVFDILQDRIEEKRFLDLFAGSGAMGFEALSRGAAHVTFVETNRLALKAIYQNLELLNIEATVLKKPAEEVLKKSKESFDLIYADPPYEQKGVYEALLKGVDEGEILRIEGILFVESKSPFPAQVKLKHLALIDERRFGSSLLRQYVRIS
jgi:16S rRNA (guanine966-N2)-methyltransferase